jgi:hypothetical protein
VNPCSGGILLVIWLILQYFDSRSRYKFTTENIHQVESCGVLHILKRVRWLCLTGSLFPAVHCLLVFCHSGPSSQIDSLVTDLLGSWLNTLSSPLAPEFHYLTDERVGGWSSYVSIEYCHLWPMLLPYYCWRTRGMIIHTHTRMYMYVYKWFNVPEVVTGLVFDWARLRITYT